MSEFFLDRHKVVKLRRELKNRLRKKVLVYLDTNAWIQLRDVKLGRQVDGLWQDVLALLSNSHFVCPVSIETIVEIAKQSDDLTRKTSSTLIDQLSNQCAIPDIYSRSRLEMKKMFLRFIPASKRTRKHYWTDSIFVSPSVLFGIPMPNLAHLGLNHFEEVEQQDSFVEYLWKQPTSLMIEQFAGKTDEETADLKKAASNMTAEIADHAHQIPNFQSALETEAYGAADNLLPIWFEVLRELHHGSDQHDGEYLLNTTAVAQTRNLVANIFIKEEGYRLLPSMMSQVRLHALRRWNKGQKVKANDFYDFQHVGGALAYCDVMITEKGIKSAAENSLLQLGEKYACEILDVRHSSEIVRVLKGKS